MGKVIFRESGSEIAKRRKIEKMEEEWRFGDGGEEEEVDEDAELRSLLSNVPEEMIREIIRYRDTLHEFGPYKIDFRPNFPLVGGVGPINPEQDPREYKSSMTCLRVAIDQKASNIELHKVVRVNIQPCTARHFYITFEAKDKVSGQIDVYCTKVWDVVVDKEIIVEEFFNENDVKAAADIVSSTKTS